MKLALVSTFPPERCGIAYHSHSLMQAMAQAKPDLSFFRISSGTGEQCRADTMVERSDASSLHAAFRAAKDAGCAAILVQHEFGLFGGEGGCFLIPAVASSALPVVSVLHTILKRPSTAQRESLTGLTRASTAIVAPSAFGKALLVNGYGADPARTAIIPHGCPDFASGGGRLPPFGDAWPGRTIVLTYGLLSPSKRIEDGIAAMAQLAAAHPHLLYVVAGATHPNLRRAQGERYRQSLEALRDTLGLSDHVLFLDQEFEDGELTALLARADISLCVYAHREQIVSGTLTAMLAAGSAVIATPFWHARDAADHGTVRLVPFEAPAAIADAIAGLLADSDGTKALRLRARQACSGQAWTEAGRQLVRIVEDAVTATSSPGRSPPSRAPAPSLRHISAMTTPTGLLEHCRWSIPNFAAGYCTDDNARALMLCCALAGQRCDAALQTLANTYLAFLLYAFDERQGRFRNRLGFDGRWQDEVGSEECHARSLRALLHISGSPLANARQELARELFDAGLDALRTFESRRAKAIALIGLAEACADGGPRIAMPIAHELADDLGAGLAASDDEWPWLEPALSWGNAKIPHALIAFGDAAGGPNICALGLRSLAWLVEIQTSATGLFSAIPMPGGRQRGTMAGQFDQQPIEAWSTLAACRAAFEVTGEAVWQRRGRLAFDWFVGGNIHRLNLTDARTGACYDGLTASGVNRNQGAESTLVWQLALCELRALTRAGPTPAADEETDHGRT